MKVDGFTEMLSFRRNLEMGTLFAPVFFIASNKLARFLAFLLPLKAVLLYVSSTELVQFLGYELNSAHLSFALVFTSFFFLLMAHFLLLAVKQDYQQIDDLLNIGSYSKAKEKKIYQAIKSGYLLLASLLLVIFLGGIGVLLGWYFLVVILLYYLCLRLMVYGDGLEPDVVEARKDWLQFCGIVFVVFEIVIALEFDQDFGVYSALFHFIAFRQVMGYMSDILNSSRVLSAAKHNFVWSVESLRTEILEGDLRQTFSQIYSEECLSVSFQNSTSVKAKVLLLKFQNCSRLVKIYPRSMRDVAIRDRENSLIGQQLLLAIPFETTFSTVDGWHINSYIDDVIENLERADYLNSLNGILLRLWKADISEYTLRKYDVSDFENVLSQHRQVLEYSFEQGWHDKVVSTFSELSTGLHNPDLNSRFAFRVSSGVAIAFWDRLEIKPIGSYLEVIKNKKYIDYDFLSSELQACGMESASQDFKVGEALSRFDMSLKRSMYVSALKQFDRLSLGMR